MDDTEVASIKREFPNCQVIAESRTRGPPVLSAPDVKYLAIAWNGRDDMRAEQGSVCWLNQHPNRSPSQPSTDRSDPCVCKMIVNRDFKRTAIGAGLKHRIGHDQFVGRDADIRTALDFGAHNGGVRHQIEIEIGKTETHRNVRHGRQSTDLHRISTY